MKTNEKLLVAMSWLEDDIIEEAQTIKSRKIFSLKPLSALAASLVFIVGTVFILHFALSSGLKGGSDANSAPGSEPEFDVSDDNFKEDCNDEAEEDEEDEKESN